MKEKNLNNSVYSALQKNENGFSLASALFSLTILTITLPLIPIIIDTLDYDTHYHDFSTRQFFHFVLREVHDSDGYSVSDSSLVLQKEDGAVVTIGRYNNTIRRQVNNLGNEIMLRDIKKFHVDSLPFGFTLTVITIEGESYEKNFHFNTRNK